MINLKLEKYQKVVKHLNYFWMEKILIKKESSNLNLDRPWLMETSQKWSNTRNLELSDMVENALRKEISKQISNNKLKSGKLWIAILQHHY